MKYTDNAGDVWEDVADGLVRAVVVGGTNVDYAEPHDIDYVARHWGPLALVDEEAGEIGETGLPTVEDVMDRVDTFRAAHALVSDLEWDEKATVYDVLQVAKWLEGDE